MAIMTQHVVCQAVKPFCMVWDVPHLCRWVLAQPEERFATRSEQLGGDYGTMTPSGVADVLPRAFRHDEITQQTVDAVLTKLSRNLSRDDAVSLRDQYTTELALQRKVNRDDDEDED